MAAPREDDNWLHEQPEWRVRSTGAAASDPFLQGPKTAASAAPLPPPPPALAERTDQSTTRLVGLVVAIALLSLIFMPLGVLVALWVCPWPVKRKAIVTGVLLLVPMFIGLGWVLALNSTQPPTRVVQTTAPRPLATTRCRFAPC